MIKFSIKNPVFEEDGVKLTFKRCYSDTFSNWLMDQEEKFNLDVKMKKNESGKDVVDLDNLTNKQYKYLMSTGNNFMADRLLNIEGLKDCETGNEISFEVLSRDRESVINFIDETFKQSEKFSEFFNKYKDGAEKKSD